MGGRNMSYTLDSYCTFNWYHQIFSIGITIDIFFVYSYMFLYMYAFNFKQYQFRLVFKFFIHIYTCFICAYYISISLSTNFSYAKLDFFNNYYTSIDYVSIGILYKLMHHFIQFFIKGEKIHISPFYWFYFFYSHILCSK